tara:strand:- start:107 stop:970 length:864 start_codon:yes stop_codon:yes gene_type:complete
MKLKLKEKVWIGTFVSLWLIVSTVSTIHSVEFFKLSNGAVLSWALAFAFELGAIGSLGGLIISRGSKGLVWALFIALTAFQIHCNMYWSWINAGDLTEWIHLLSLIDEDPDIQKRIFTIVSGGILPLIALGFMKSLMDYLNPSKLKDEDEPVIETDPLPPTTEGPQGPNGPDDSGLVFSGPMFTNEEIEQNNKLREQEIRERAAADAEHLKAVIESQDTYEEENQIEPSNGITQRELLEQVDKEIEEDKKSTDKPFWSKLDPRKTISLLNNSDDKIQKEVSTETPQK